MDLLLTGPHLRHWNSAPAGRILSSHSGAVNRRHSCTSKPRAKAGGSFRWGRATAGPIFFSAALGSSSGRALWARPTFSREGKRDANIVMVRDCRLKEEKPISNNHLHCRIVALPFASSCFGSPGPATLKKVKVRRDDIGNKVGEQTGSRYLPDVGMVQDPKVRCRVTE